jgi:hypothetical protein
MQEGKVVAYSSR